MIARITSLYATVWIVMTVADEYMTHRAVTVFGEYEELNPLGVGSASTIIWTGIVLLLFGSVAVAVGAWRLSKNDLAVHDPRFRAFLREAFKPRCMVWTWLIVVPLMLAFGRIIPVLSNVSYLSLGWSPFMTLVAHLSHTTGASEYIIYRVSLVGLAWILFLPVTYVLHLIVRGLMPGKSRSDSTA